MIAVLLTGALSKITQRTGKSGTEFGVATITVTSGAGRTYWRVFIFSEEVQAELGRLADGDHVAIQGTPKFQIWKPENGEPRLTFSVVADRILALRQPPKARQNRKAKPPQPEIPMTNLTAHAGDGADVFGDSIPF